MRERVSLSLKACAVLLLATLGALTDSQRAAPSPGEVSLQGYLSGRGSSVESQPSWLAGGFGKLRTGAMSAEDSETSALGQLQLVLDWEPSSRFGLYLHGVARAEDDISEGEEVGVVEAFVYGSVLIRRRDLLRFQLGHLILPTSHENVEVAWSSPYTITFSALNSWIGEDVRVSGLLSEYRLATGGARELRVGASSFGGNDASGALLAWRGWAMGDRLTTFGEIVPLPAIDSLEPGGAFAVQLDRGTQPFGSDLDSRVGWAAYARWLEVDRFSLQWTHYQNRGDRQLHNGDEYAWTTEFDLFGFDFHPAPRWSFAGEYLAGSTGMGDKRFPHVQLDMDAVYFLTSFHTGRFRVTLRFDSFEIQDLDRTIADNNDESGEAWTLALFWEPSPYLRLGLELIDLAASHPEALESGFDPDTDARSAILEIRYYFDW